MGRNRRQPERDRRRHRDQFGAGGRLIRETLMPGQWKVSWHHQRLGIPAIWENGITGKGVTVALLDTGLGTPTGLDRTDFEYLDARGARIQPGDPQGHGTCCGSIITSYVA